MRGKGHWRLPSMHHIMLLVWNARKNAFQNTVYSSYVYIEYPKLSLPRKQSVYSRS